MNCDDIQALIDDLLAMLRERGIRAQAIYTVTKDGYVSAVRIDILS